MPIAENLVVIGCVVLGGMTFLRLLCGARMVAVMDAERRSAEVEAVNSSQLVTPEVSGDDA